MLTDPRVRRLELSQEEDGTRIRRSEHFAAKTRLNKILPITQLSRSFLLDVYQF